MSHTITEDQAEEAVMGWQVAGKLPPGWTKGTLATAYLILEARDAKTDHDAQVEEDRRAESNQRMHDIRS